MNALALTTHVPGQIVPERDFMRDRCATVAAIVHRNMRYSLSMQKARPMNQALSMDSINALCFAHRAKLPARATTAKRAACLRVRDEGKSTRNLSRSPA